ncbi:MAG: TIR domain-containing protein [Clostridia bacterium]|nr:TIR domain-containing protein [Clostridia bacterium]
MNYAFISYKTDDVEVARWVKDRLEEKGIPCWFAPVSIPGGSNYAKEIPKAIKNCFAFVLILSKTTHESKYVPKEIDLAINTGKTILPFMIDDFELSDDFSFYLSNVNRFPAYESREKCIDLIASRIEDILNGTKGGKSIEEIKADIRAAKQQQAADQYHTDEISLPAQYGYSNPASPHTPVINNPVNSGQQYINNGSGQYPPVYTNGATFNISYDQSNRSFILTLLLSIFLGYFGIHRFYAGKILSGIIWFFTGGFFFVGWGFDIVTILLGRFKDSEGKFIKPQKR